MTRASDIKAAAEQVACLPPHATRHCQCARNPLRAFYCRAGHMTECHYPLECASAGCGHLVKYEYTPDEVLEMKVETYLTLKALAEPGCEACQGQGTRKRDFTGQDLFGPAWRPGRADSTYTLLVWCDCVRGALHRLATAEGPTT